MIYVFLFASLFCRCVCFCCVVIVATLLLAPGCAVQRAHCELNWAHKQWAYIYASGALLIIFVNRHTALNVNILICIYFDNISITS
jgi:hypothetical protein